MTFHINCILILPKDYYKLFRCVNQWISIGSGITRSISIPERISLPFQQKAYILSLSAGKHNKIKFTQTFVYHIKTLYIINYLFICVREENLFQVTKNEVFDLFHIGQELSTAQNQMPECCKCMVILQNHSLNYRVP